MHSYLSQTNYLKLDNSPYLVAFSCSDPVNVNTSVSGRFK